MADPAQIVATAHRGHHVVGWKLVKDDRKHLLEQFVPKFSRTIADHVTLAAKVASDTRLPDQLPAAVVGHASDGAGVEALVVAIDGVTDRPDGSTYHITWSLADGRRAQESNDVIAKQGWLPLGEPVPVVLAPALFQ
ncbi:hypothetical protein [Novosphingobium sp. JCM 18896]|uniref:hypothetical protein n=1 Tax=Novosphingobium sp. JCM 18896 TaxID=2989731 RepID=UPI0022225F5E|nr:hypothetical protein [Novosphingobium sp. JCM 18896]MCW1432080.1 hypothetical protein [Novosphingobium sp. JCM 18896]